ncbi:beta-ketoacyl synthase domain-containing protein [Xylona heveae TC161]|uniref:Beta-ketoacyl synthase domain-containing protein n=1 Tax=Xylona heveae (strain CBS 132557 / TC161) TaxID=1328760 RepID=A0A165ISY0_XYLHT|nr:beta-ketoacyl synthase domain-containing protein [Xylona heveae TC161]KZF25341.1 beta-ketoacyl synthase domain-containing protein [Xylona heveae TC161]
METPSSASESLNDSINNFNPEDLTTNLIYFSNDFPNDDLKDLFRRLHRHSKDRRFTLLATFLENCARVLKEETNHLPQSLRELVPPFETLFTLVDGGQFRLGPLGASMESAFLCALQVGMIIGHYEGRHIDYDLNAQNTVLAGLSIGLLAGAAVSLSKDLHQLATTGAESVRVAFRLGLYIDEISRKIEVRDPNAPPQSWAYVVTGLSAEEIQPEIDRYNTSSGNTELTKIFLSAVDKTSVSVSGPPSRLKEIFLRSQILRHSKHLPLPVYEGMCHAPHLYNKETIWDVISKPDPKILRNKRVQIPLISSQTGKPFNSLLSGFLYEEICAELLTGSIFVDKVTAGILDGITKCHFLILQVNCFRPTLVANGIISAIEQQLPQVGIKRQDMLDWITEDFGPRQPRNFKDSKVAIVGMACRMPGGADDTELFWKILDEGRDTHTRVPADRFDLETHYDPTGKTENATQTPFGNFIDSPGLFDAGFFNMSPKEAEQTDPMQRLALVTAYEALEMAGYSPNRTSSTNCKRVGAYYGQASDDWRELNASQNLGTYAVPGGVRAFANGRINYFFGFSGPSINLDTACSSGLAAVQAGCSALWAGEADTIVAGGLNVITDPDNYAGLCNAHFLSKTGQCKVWDQNADGYCRADGVGSVVLKRLEDAEDDNDNILGVILAAATNHSAKAISITHPHAGAQKDNYNQVMRAAAINPLDVSFIELHGTGTQAGDTVECESVCDVFAPLSSRRRADQSLLLGAVKSNIGHGEAAAGIASLLKMLLVYQKDEIPPHIGIKTEINPAIGKYLDKRNVGLAMEETPYPRKKGSRRFAVVNSFGAHGGNTTVLLEDAPARQVTGVDPRSTHVVTVSAKSKASLKGNIEDLLSYVEKNPATSIGDLAYTTCARRIHHNFRVATAVSNTDQLRRFLENAVESVSDLRPVPLDAPSVAFTFTGQGAFYEGIGAQLFEQFPYYRTQILQLDQLVQRFGYQSIIPVINEIDGSTFSPLMTQLSILVVEIALSRLWTFLGIQPNAVIGHSLGEYSALVAADVISAADAILLVGQRASYTMSTCEAGTHLMLSVLASVDQIQKLIGEDGKYEVSCRNGHSDTVISGNREDIEEVRQHLEASGLKCTPLHLPFAFHTKQMDPMLDSFEQMAKGVSFKPPRLPVISPLLGACVFDGKTINAAYLRRASREPVDFVGALDAAQAMGIIDSQTIWVEVGPQPICASFITKHIHHTTTLPSLKKNEDNFTTIAKALASLHTSGVPISWNEYYAPYESSHILLNLPHYHWNVKNYWIQYIGTWTLDKALLKYGQNKSKGAFDMHSASNLRTSSVHQITLEEITSTTGQLKTVSDVMHPDFLSSIKGHAMNHHGVATSSIWCDMAYTAGEYLFKRMSPACKQVHMNLADMEVLHAIVAKKVSSRSQLIALECNLNISSRTMTLAWSQLEGNGNSDQVPFATAKMYFEEAADWRNEWDRLTHLVTGRIEALGQMASTGACNKISKNLTYSLFKNVVDYADKYRGMDSVVLNGYEAYADITLIPETHGNWHTPPHWIDPVCHLAGFIMNASDVLNTKDYFYVTPGFGTSRLIEPLSPSAKYRSYVHMLPTANANMHAGDVYILRDNVIVGMLGQIKFKRISRILMGQFFSPSEESVSAHASPTPPPSVGVEPAVPPASVDKVVKVTPPSSSSSSSSSPPPPQAIKTESAVVAKSVPVEAETGVVGEAVSLIARETGLEVSEVADETTFVQIGVDSLMSLVLAEKFRSQLQLDVKSSLFLDCPTIGDLKGWLEQYC